MVPFLHKKSTQILSWAVLRASWGRLGGVWGRLGGVLGRLGRLLAALGKLWAGFGRPKSRGAQSRVGAASKRVGGGRRSRWPLEGTFGVAKSKSRIWHAANARRGRGGLNDASRSPPALHVLAGKLDSHLALALLSFLAGLVLSRRRCGLSVRARGS